ncbi:MAG TPA: hypothetical protein PK430_04875 [Muribaculum sp.]|uniref:Neutral/alkaline non-lysosomal ceramidase N-terminal domain-containing protein n=1 Tax=Heminiphilus faecis TaxID=2601703 RepID=A0ABV4CTX4_9BACT|nr:hypothetical protein [Heminiphilus faecis]RLT76962.1 hypothetical protein D7V95_05500 [bacterium J10(2018)]HRF68538.1 hypothetical protein [Muribaculum sp.]
MRKIIFALAMVAILLSPVCSSGARVMRGGTAKTNITPVKPYYPVHDSVYARALVLEADSMRLGFVSLDLGGYTNPGLVERLRKRHGIDRLFFSLSHTHSSRVTPENAAYVERQIEEAVDGAVADMSDVCLSSGYRSFPPIAFNRLIMRDNGKVLESWEGDDHWLAVNPECIVHGPIDPAVGVIKVEDVASGTPKAVVMNFACHPDVVWNNFEVSADYVGYAARYVEEAFDTPVNCLFIQGGAGNQAPLFKDGGRESADDPRPAKYHLIERMGKLLGIEAVKLTKALYPDPRQEASIQIMTDSLCFTGRQDKSLDYNVHFSNIVLNNNIVIAAVPGEPFIKFQIDWKNEMAPEGTPFLFGYTWGSGSWPVYLPDIRSASLGGFGAEYGPGMIEYGAGDKIYNRLTENHYRLTRGINP